MDPTERRSLIEQLHASRDTFLETVRDVSEEQAAFKPMPDCWSIKEITEHVAVAEHGMYRLITTYCQPLETPAGREREESLLRRTADRQQKLEAPERVRPRGRYESLSKALQQFRANRERTIQYVSTCEDDLRKRETEHLVGRISCPECLMVLISHPVRHAGQVREIKQSPGYPSKSFEAF